METLFKDSYTDIVFEKRNKSFGAYTLRKKYAKMVLSAFVISILLFSLAIASPIIYSFFEKEKQIEETHMVVAEMINVEEVAQPKEQEIKKTEPQKESIKFPPIEIKPDDKVQTEEEVATEDDLKKSNPGSETHEGEKGRSSEDASPVVEPEKPKEPVVIPDETVYAWADQDAQFPGGDEEYIKYVKSKLHYTAEAKASNIQGVVVIEFVVNKDGSLTDFKLLKSLGYGLDEAAMTIIQSMPRWKPGSLNGEVKKIRKRVKIPFSLR